MTHIFRQVRGIIVFNFVTQEKYVTTALIFYISKQNSESYSLFYSRE